MTVTNIQKDVNALTLTVTSRFTASSARLWQIWADPRQLEQWWGPPTFPATVVEHDFRAGGKVIYFMTSPEGDKYHGWWKITHVDVETRLEFEDGFGDDTGAPDPHMPVTTTIMTLTSVGEEVTEMTSTTQFGSLEALDQLIDMGMIEGLVSALGQVTHLLST
jgi:uncharacterized protein YndB with AHSA1/START domain